MATAAIYHYYKILLKYYLFQYNYSIIESYKIKKISQFQHIDIIELIYVGLTCIFGRHGFCNYAQAQTLNVYKIFEIVYKYL